ncbi:hypothetical protein RhiirA4_470393 [Rhizophagus irregularis]|uniref:Uncharacterized protein n=1 Tax=Rhizophagus irregularis TaxID=588596 RepID=A0A2I1H167_9GLOM|nr:hypothetical protein RhiirA4_470393 [Rhizophagus irregularis]
MSNIEKEKYPGYLGKYINGKWRKTKELIIDNWIELNGAWLSRFSQASKELDPTFDFEDKADNTVSMFDLVEDYLPYWENMINDRKKASERVMRTFVSKALDIYKVVSENIAEEIIKEFK